MPNRPSKRITGPGPSGHAPRERKSWLAQSLLVTTALAVGIPMSAHAQEATAPAADEEEVIVTARKREESLQDVPISVSVALGEDLEQRNITSTTQIDTLAPSLSVAPSVGFVSFFLRGVGSNVAIPGAENSVATYIDGVYMARPTSAWTSLPNIERIEILRGPQGTLFGRNATGGLVNIITRKPSHDLGFRGSVTLANEGVLEANAFLTGPLSDKLAASLVVAARTQDGGYGTNLLSGKDIYKSEYINILGKLRYDFDASLSAELAAYFNDVDNNINGAQSVVVTRPSTANGGTLRTGGSAAPARFTTTPRDNYSNIDPLYRLIDRGASLTVVKDWESVSFTSITAYNSSYGSNGSDFDLTDASGWSVAFVPGGVNTANPTQAFQATYDSPYFWMQELRLTSTGDGPLQWVAGVYGQSNRDGYDPVGVYLGQYQPLWSNRGRYDVVGYSQAIVGISRTEALAAFAQATYAVTDRLDITAGLRYNKETKDYSSALYAVSSAGVPTLSLTRSASKSWERPTWVVDASYDLGEAMVYASYNRGFRSGAFNVSSPTATTPVDEEVIDAYEAGFKSTLMSGALRLNGSAYFYDFQNLQFLTISATTGTAILQNAAAAEIKGVELEALYSPTDNLNLFANVGIIDSQYTAFPNYVARMPQRNAAGVSIGGTINTVVPVVGKALMLTPEYTATLGANYEHKLSTSLALELSGDVTLKGETSMNPEATIVQEAYSAFNGSIGVRIPRGDTTYRVSAWGRNLSDEDIIVYGAGTFNTLRAAYAEPRTYGIRLSIEH
jgi:iron complex outermembrane receptor protein